MTLLGKKPPHHITVRVAGEVFLLIKDIIQTPLNDGKKEIKRRRGTYIHWAGRMENSGAGSEMATLRQNETTPPCKSALLKG